MEKKTEIEISIKIDIEAMIRKFMKKRRSKYDLHVYTQSCTHVTSELYSGLKKHLIIHDYNYLT